MCMCARACKRLIVLIALGYMGCKFFQPKHDLTQVSKGIYNLTQLINPWKANLRHQIG